MNVTSFSLSQLPVIQFATAAAFLAPSFGVYIIVKTAQWRGYTVYPILIFLGSYLPLYPILLWQTLNQQYTILGTSLPAITVAGVDWSIFAIIAANLLAVAFLYQGMILILAWQRAGVPADITVLDDITPVANQYILVYIYPLLLLDYTKIFDITVFLIVFASIAIIQVRIDRYMMNPVLVFFGYHFYYVEIDGSTAFLLSRNEFEEGETDEISEITISNNVRVHSGRT
jgi:hypothetical protein